MVEQTIEREKFLSDRRTGIGGSDAAALCGLSPFKTSHDVYMEKLGLAPDSAPSARMEAGIRLEPVLAEWYANEKGVQVGRHPMVRHEDHNFMFGHIDRTVYNGVPEGRKYPLIEGLLEIKTTDARFAWLWGEPGTDSVPDAHNLQCQHYMAVTGLKWADIAVLIGGNDFRIYRVPRNDNLIKDLIEIEGRFWEEHILAKVPPPVEGTEASKRLLSALYPKDSGMAVLADGTIDKTVGEYFELTNQVKSLESQKLLAENLIKAFMGDASVFSGPGYRFSWKQTKDRVKVAWETIARELWEEFGSNDFPKHSSFEYYVEAHTKTSPGARPFRPTKLRESSNGK